MKNKNIKLLLHIGLVFAFSIFCDAQVVGTPYAVGNRNLFSNINCSASSSGSIIVGQALSGVTQTIAINYAGPSVPYNISTSDGGVTFSGTGTLQSGINNIILTGSGVANTYCTLNFTVTIGGATCTFSRTAVDDGNWFSLQEENESGNRFCSGCTSTEAMKKIQFSLASNAPCTINRIEIKEVKTSYRYIDNDLCGFFKTCKGGFQNNPLYWDLSTATISIARGGNTGLQGPFYYGFGGSGLQYYSIDYSEYPARNINVGGNGNQKIMVKYQIYYTNGGSSADIVKTF